MFQGFCEVAGCVAAEVVADVSALDLQCLQVVGDAEFFYQIDKHVDCIVPDDREVAHRNVGSRRKEKVDATVQCKGRDQPYNVRGFLVKISASAARRAPSGTDQTNMAATWSVLAGPTWPVPGRQ